MYVLYDYFNVLYTWYVIHNLRVTHELFVMQFETSILLLFMFLFPFFMNALCFLFGFFCFVVVSFYSLSYFLSMSLVLYSIYFLYVFVVLYSTYVTLLCKIYVLYVAGMAAQGFSEIETTKEWQYTGASCMFCMYFYVFCLIQTFLFHSCIIAKE